MGLFRVRSCCIAPGGSQWHLNTLLGDVERDNGYGGQKIILLSRYNAILVMTGGGYNQPSHTNGLFSRYILPGVLPYTPR